MTGAPALPIFILPLSLPVPILITDDPEVLMLVVPTTVRADRVPTDVSEDVTTVEFRVVPVRVPAAAVTVMLAVPSKATLLIFLAVCRAVAVAALPEIEPVIVLLTLS